MAALPSLLPLGGFALLYGISTASVRYATQDSRHSVYKHPHSRARGGPRASGHPLPDLSNDLERGGAPPRSSVGEEFERCPARETPLHSLSAAPLRVSADPLKKTAGADVPNSLLGSHNETTAHPPNEAEDASVSVGNCTKDEILLEFFPDADAPPKGSCCPLPSLACAGCATYTGGNQCELCQPGFVLQCRDPDSDPNCATPVCVACVDIPGFIDQNGKSCSAVCDASKPPEYWQSENMRPTLEKSRSKKGHVSAKDACCACGGGLRQATPFTYDQSSDFIVNQTIKLLPMPRTATHYVPSAGCKLSEYGLTLNGETGEVSGTPVSENPIQVSCSILALQNAEEGLVFNATLSFSTQMFGYGHHVLSIDSPEAQLLTATTSETTHPVPPMHSNHSSAKRTAASLLHQSPSPSLAETTTPPSTFRSLVEVRSHEDRWDHIPSPSEEEQLGEETPTLLARSSTASSSSSTLSSNSTQTMTLISHPPVPASGYVGGKWKLVCTPDAPWLHIGFGGDLWGTDSLPKAAGVGFPLDSTPMLHETGLVGPFEDLVSQLEDKVGGSPKDKKDNGKDTPSAPVVPLDSALAVQCQISGVRKPPQTHNSTSAGPSRSEADQLDLLIVNPKTWSGIEYPSFPTEGLSLSLGTPLPISSPFKPSDSGKKNGQVQRLRPALFSAVCAKEGQSEVVTEHNVRTGIVSLKTSSSSLVSLFHLDPLTGILSGETGVGDPAEIDFTLTEQSLRAELALVCWVWGRQWAPENASAHHWVKSARLNFVLADSTCWQQIILPSKALQPAFLLGADLDKMANAKSSSDTCRKACTSLPNCAAYTFDSSGGCQAVQRVDHYMSVQEGGCSSVDGSTSPDCTSAHFRLRNCFLMKTCLHLQIPNEAWLTGTFCPLVPDLKTRSALYARQGGTQKDGKYLVPYVAARDPEGLCPSGGTKWLLQEVSPGEDFVDPEASEFFLKGEVVACVPSSLTGSVTLKGGNQGNTLHSIFFFQPQTCPSPMAVVSGSPGQKATNGDGGGDEKEEVSESEKEEEGQDGGALSSERIYIFDHPLINEPPTTPSAREKATSPPPLGDDPGHTVDPCDCFPAEWGGNYPVVDEQLRSLPAAMKNDFAAGNMPSFLVARGPVSCLLGDMISLAETDKFEICEKLCILNPNCYYFWLGTSGSLHQCRLFVSCSALMLQQSTAEMKAISGTLYALVRQAACLVANPEECHAQTKRRQFLTGTAGAQNAPAGLLQIDQEEVSASSAGGVDEDALLGDAGRETLTGAASVSSGGARSSAGADSAVSLSGEGTVLGKAPVAWKAGQKDPVFGNVWMDDINWSMATMPAHPPPQYGTVSPSQFGPISAVQWAGGSVDFTVNPRLIDGDELNMPFYTGRAPPNVAAYIDLGASKEINTVTIVNRCDKSPAAIWGGLDPQIGKKTAWNITTYVTDVDISGLYLDPATADRADVVKCGNSGQVDLCKSIDMKCDVPLKGQFILLRRLGSGKPVFVEEKWRTGFESLLTDGDFDKPWTAKEGVPGPQYIRIDLQQYALVERVAISPANFPQGDDRYFTTSGAQVFVGSDASFPGRNFLCGDFNHSPVSMRQMDLTKYVRCFVSVKETGVMGRYVYIYNHDNRVPFSIREIQVFGEVGMSQYGEWSPWGACKSPTGANCGRGVQTRTRTCVPPAIGARGVTDQNCQDKDNLGINFGPSTQQQACKLSRCPEEVPQQPPQKPAEQPTGKPPQTPAEPAGKPPQQPVVQQLGCLAEHLMLSCELNKQLGFKIDECGQCKYRPVADAPNYKKKTLLPSEFQSGAQLTASCWKDRFRLLDNKAGSKPVPAVGLTCVDGEWIDHYGDPAFANHECASCLEVAGGAMNTLAKGGNYPMYFTERMAWMLVFQTARNDARTLYVDPDSPSGRQLAAALVPPADRIPARTTVLPPYSAFVLLQEKLAPGTLNLQATQLGWCLEAGLGSKPGQNQIATEASGCYQAGSAFRPESLLQILAEGAAQFVKSNDFEWGANSSGLLLQESHQSKDGPRLPGVGAAAERGGVSVSRDARVAERDFSNGTAGVLVSTVASEKEGVAGDQVLLDNDWAVRDFGVSDPEAIQKSSALLTEKFQDFPLFTQAAALQGLQFNKDGSLKVGGLRTLAPNILDPVAGNPSIYQQLPMWDLRDDMVALGCRLPDEVLSQIVSVKPAFENEVLQGMDIHFSCYRVATLGGCKNVTATRGSLDPQDGRDARSVGRRPGKMP
uniref:Apple domain-containing protein n=1 Tax=Chromera velia CCMP2878 TaxID=1169474 RepID=A0A0G4HP76_9ALVE|eukprot:Cvel_7735.t1-p1 / transcript=Cvel_7735.t1 / gene=Cvel_7735 / organism=Chromera_velia_CCMP2878 / gene_product=hypothetical protein / transcript_product=hypothetical protein / location=Cvel_scaffold411:51173-71801(-) / protein_length=2229 / sequence_SO=supercontig / SO=protein_coding / is_pseudo=false